MLTTTNNNESNNYSMYSNMSRDMIKKGDIKDKCTASCFGLVPLHQECYYCPKCDPTHQIRLCLSCFEDCHFDCTYDIDNYNKEDYCIDSSLEFSCECFSLLKHRVRRTQKKDSIKCELKILDKFLLPTKYFYCDDEKLLLCSFCYFSCHSDCDDKKILTGKEINELCNLNNSLSTFSICQCRHTNHSSNNEFLFQISVKEYSEEMEISFWPIQLINFTFSIDSVFSKFILHFKQNEFSHSEFKEMVSNNLMFVKDLCYIINRKFTNYYFSEKVRKIFSIETLEKLISKCSVKDEKQIQFLFGLLYLLMCIHLKKDFSLINKPLTSSDFLSGDPIQRINYRKKTKFFCQKEKSKNEEDEYIDSPFEIKYGKNFQNIINLLFQQLFPLLNNILQNSNFSLISFREEIEIFLKFVCFLLKKHIFSMNQLKELIDNLEVIHSKIILHMNFKNEMFVKSWIGLFCFFSEIFFFIAVIYNDLVIEEYLSQKEYEEKVMEGNFIHSDSNYGQKLLRMIMKSNSIVCKHYKMLTTKNRGRESQIIDNKVMLLIQREKNKKQTLNSNYVSFKKPTKGIITQKFLKFYHESVIIFSLSNNIYLTQIKEICLNELDTNDDSSQKKNEEENEDKESTFDFNITDLKQSIENKINFLFLNYTSIEQTKLIADSIKFIISEFMTKCSKENIYTYQGINDNVEEIKSSTNNNKSITFSSEIEPQKKIGIIEEKYQIYVQKVVDFNKYVNSNFIENVYQNINNISQQLINSNIDSVLSSLLIIFSDKRCKILTFEFLELILSFMSIFFLNKKTMKYFILGKNINYLNKIFHRYSLNKKSKINYNPANLKTSRYILEFYQLFLQGIIIYDINLSNHKFLTTIRKNIINDHINEFYIYQKDKNDLQMEFKIQLNISSKIFLMIANFYDSDDFNNIKMHLLQIFNEIIKEENFFKFYTRDVGNGRGFQIKRQASMKLKRALSMKSMSKYVTKRHIKVHDNDDLSNTPIAEKIDIELTYGFFEIFSKRTFFINEKIFPILDNVNKFFDYNKNSNDDKEENLINEEESINHSTILYIFENESLAYNERLIILTYLRTICFIERIKFQNVKDEKHTMTTSDYINYISSKMSYETLKENFPSVSFDSIENELKSKKELENQYKKLKRIILLSKLYLNELKQLEEIKNSSIDLDQYLKRKYISELVFGMKVIADFFYIEKNVWNKPIIHFYVLSIEFIQKVNTIIKILNDTDENMIDPKNIREIIQEMTYRHFDIFDIDTIYKNVIEKIEIIFQKTKINSKYSLVNFLDTFDHLQENNFIPDSLIEDKDYEYFYENIGTPNQNEEQHETDVNNPKRNIINVYTEQFIDVQRTALIMVIKNISNDINKINYRKKFVDYFKSYLNSEINNSNFESLLCLITKIFFYDTEEMKELLMNLIVKTFFNNFQKVLQKNIYQTYLTCRNFTASINCMKVMNLSKLVLQFLQLLGEGFCINFQEIIFEKKIAENEPTIFQEVISTLQSSLVKLDYKCEIDAELPYDKLIILITNLIDFIIEYLVTKKDFAVYVEQSIDELLFQEPKMIEILTTRLLNLHNPFSNRIKILFYVKVKIIQLIISYLQNGNKKTTLKKLNIHRFSTVEIFDEIIYTFLHLMKRIKIEFPKKYGKVVNASTVDGYVENLLDLYSKEEKFRDTLELKLCCKMFILINIMDKKYGQKDIWDHFNKAGTDENSFNKNPSDWSIHSLNAYKIYKFFNEIVLSIEVEVEVVSNEELEEDGKEIQKTIPEQKDELILETEDPLKTVVPTLSAVNNDVSKYQNIFYIRPYLSFFISEQSRRNFLSQVDRETAIGKYTGLMKATDFFLFDMVVNKNFIMSNMINKFFCDFNFTVFEWINFLLIIIQNIMLLANTYHGAGEEDYYYDQSKGNFYQIETHHLILSIIQIIFIVFIVIIYMKYKFILCYQRNLMLNHNKNFVFRQKKDMGEKKITNTLVNFFQGNSDNIWETLKSSSEDITLSEKVKVALLDSILLNREICIFLYTFVFIIFYLIFGVELLLIVPTLFICNLSTNLFPLYAALIRRWYSMGLVLMFTYIVTYIFAWCAFYFLHENFVFDDIIDMRNGDTRTESFCSSIVQCWMFNMDYGVRPQFGGGDVLGKLSFKNDATFYVIRWIYDTLFYIFIVLILRNLFFSIIVEAFAELRNQNYQRENDQKNICFICQISRDECLYKSLDFKEHVEIKHNMWNYVYFLMTLHLSNTSELDQVQKVVWDKIGNQDYTWIPNSQEGNHN